MPETSATTTPNLLDRIRARDPEGWRQFVQLYTPLVYYWCRKAGLQGADAADIAQEVFRSVLAGVAAFHHNSPGDTLRGWLFVICRHKLADHFRRVKSQSEAESVSDSSRRSNLIAAESSLADEHNEPRSPAVADLVNRALQHVQSEFESSTWRAFWNVTVEGLSPADVAESLKISTNAVYKAKSRVLCRLREELGDRLG